MGRGDFSRDFAGNFGQIVFEGGGLYENLVSGPKKMMDAIYTALEVEAPRLEAQMKTQAPWTDQTGNARNGLAARAYRSGDEMGILLYHQVPYGIWLELANDSRYAIIIPTMENEADRVAASVQGLLSKMRF